MNRLPCGTLESHLSALVDDALPGAARERLSAHVLSCRHCSATLAGLRGTRDLLRRQGRATAPDGELARRLVAIGATSAGSAGHASSDPLAGLRRRRRPLAGPAPRIGLVAALFALVMVTGVGWVAAPEVRAEAVDPSQAHVEYAGTTATAVLGSVATAAALAAPTGSLRVAGRGAGEPALEPYPVVAGATLRPSVVAALVQRAAGATTAVREGTWQVAVSGAQGEVRAVVAVEGRPGQGTQLRVLTRDGDEVATRFVPAEQDWNPHAVAAFAGQVTARAGQSVAGRTAVLLEAAGAGDSIRRWWVDEATGVLLRSEVSVAGRVSEAAGYSSVTIDTAADAFLSHLAPPLNQTSATQSLSTSAALSLGNEGWFCRQRVAGLDLAAARGDSAGRPGRLHLTYADATQQVMVLQRPGVLPSSLPGFVFDPASGTWVRQGWPTVITWQSGSTVIVVVGVAPSPVLSGVVGSLPHQARTDPNPVERLQSGWARVGGLVFG